MKSIWVAIDVLRDGCVWRVETGDKTDINNDAWFPQEDHHKLVCSVQSLQNCKVSELIDHSLRVWKSELIMSTFSKIDADRILSLLLSVEACDNLLVWTKKASGEFSVRSSYKLLQKISLEPILMHYILGLGNFIGNFGVSISP